MIPYASHTTTKRNLAALKAADWRVLISAAAPQHWDARGFAYALDNGEWARFQAFIRAKMALGMKKAEAEAAWFAGGWAETPFNEAPFEALIDLMGAGADWIVLPDIVAGGLASLALSVRWMNRVLACGAPLVLIAVQDGMTPADLEPFVGQRVGIFLGGSTEWKLATAVMWGTWCAALGVWFHFARVNTLQRFALAHDAGACSIDGSSATKYSDTLELLERGVRQGSLLAPRRAA